MELTGTTAATAATAANRGICESPLQCMEDVVLGKHGDCASQNLSPLIQEKEGLVRKQFPRCSENPGFSKHNLSVSKIQDFQNMS